MAPQWERGKIYKISIGEEMVYIGSTTMPLAQRWSQHKSDARAERNNCSLHSQMRELGESAFSMELFEDWPWGGLRAREGDLIRHFQPRLNKNIPCRTSSEWWAAHREELNKKKKQQRNKSSRVCPCGGHFDCATEKRHMLSQRHQAFLARQKEDVATGPFNEHD
jgi:hypothetical protein